MSLVIDLLIIAAAAISVYFGITKGFIKSVMQFASLIIALIAVFVFTAPVSDLLYKSFVEKEVSNITGEALTGIITAGEEHLALDKIMTDKPEALTEITDRFSVNIDEIISYYKDSLKSLAESDAVGELADAIAKPTAEAVSTVVAAILVFVVSMLVLALITFILDSICRLPVLRRLNTFFGFIFGLGSALVSAWVIANVSVGLINALEAINSEMFNETVISGSFILRFFYNNSLILF